MPTDATFHQAPMHDAVQSGGNESLPAGAGLALAVLLGSVIWIGIFAMLM